MRYILLLLLFTSCFSDKKPNYTKEEFLKMARTGEPNLRIVTATSISEAVVNCTDYTPRCRFGYRVVVRNIEMVALFYENQEDALSAAKRIKGYIARNWVLDEVKDEPILERYVTKYLNAEKAF